MCLVEGVDFGNLYGNLTDLIKIAANREGWRREHVALTSCKLGYVQED